MFKRIRAKKSSPEGADTQEFQAVMDSLMPHMTADECAEWYERWEAGASNYEDSPFLRVVTFTNEVCKARNLGKTARRAIRDKLCKSLLVDRKHHAA